MLEDISDVHDEALKLRHAVDEEGIEVTISPVVA